MALELFSSYLGSCLCRSSPQHIARLKYGSWFCQLLVLRSWITLLALLLFALSTCPGS
jgi:hypothetical protein